MTNFIRIEQGRSQVLDWGEGRNGNEGTILKNLK